MVAAHSHTPPVSTRDGVLKNRENYEIMTPESIGLNQIQPNLTSRSGRAAVKHRMDEMGYKESEYNLDNLYDAFPEAGGQKGQVFDYDLEALAFIGKQQEEPEHFRLDYFSSAVWFLTISPPPPSNWPVAKKSKQKPPTVTVRSMPSIRQLTASLNITSNW
ncbi:homocitrate synthase/isopropylmalate synthase family protein [Escherichia coli]